MSAIIDLTRTGINLMTIPLRKMAHITTIYTMASYYHLTVYVASSFPLAHGVHVTWVTGLTNKMGRTTEKRKHRVRIKPCPNVPVN